MKNKIISIGFIGMKKCYLNISTSEAVKRFCESEGVTEEEYELDESYSYEEIFFDDEFGCYEIWEKH